MIFYTCAISYEAVVSSIPEQYFCFCAALMRSDTIATRYNEPLVAAHTHIHDDVTIGRYCADGQPKLELDHSQMSYEAVASSIPVLMCSYTLATSYKEPLVAAHTHIHDDRYDMVDIVLTVSPDSDWNWTTHTTDSNRAHRELYFK